MNVADKPPTTTNEDGTNVAWVDAVPTGRPRGEWAYYRHGVIRLVPESEARETFDPWGSRSCDRGAATFMIEQLWNEIDQLRARLKKVEGRPKPPA